MPFLSIWLFYISHNYNYNHNHNHDYNYYYYYNYYKWVEKYVGHECGSREKTSYMLILLIIDMAANIT